MKPAPFSYHRPATLDAALGLLDQYRAEAKPLAGGQSLGPMLNMRLARPAHVVDLNDLIELDYIRRDGAMLEIGALTRHHRLAHAPEIAATLPLLGHAARSIGHYAIRQRGTLGGSVVHADPAAQLPLVAVTTGAEVVIRSVRGQRVLPASGFLQSIMTVDLAADEMVTALRFPVPPAGAGWGFELFSRRHGDFAIASVAAMLVLDGGGRIDRLQLGIGGVGAVPLRLPEIERSVPGTRPDRNWVCATAEAVARAVAPEDDPLIPAEFRRELVRSLAADALAAAFTSAKTAVAA
ncbi:FAD binding domain-containing protein [Acidimangrovimonas pyrenivorans]|uniref:FAD binding domain-containing protein n=1 Tax=Acidimangrovimonas pyrenivorans TaxID=2030798 RepID=A0ABV7AIK5_9RHOB